MMIENILTSWVCSASFSCWTIEIYATLTGFSFALQECGAHLFPVSSRLNVAGEREISVSTVNAPFSHLSRGSDADYFQLPRANLLPGERRNYRRTGSDGGMQHSFYWVCLALYSEHFSRKLVGSLR